MNVPFETNDDGNYLVITPAEGMEPEKLTVTVMNTTYLLEGYAGKDSSSVVAPDVLAYERCDILKE